MDITHRKEDTEEDKEEDAHSTQSDIELSAQHTDTNTHTQVSFFQTPDGFTRVQRRSEKRKGAATASQAPPTGSPASQHSHKRRGRSLTRVQSSGKDKVS